MTNVISIETAKIMRELKKLSGINVKTDRSWLWVTGDTRIHKEILKSLGLRWSKKRVAWYYKGQPAATEQEAEVTEAIEETTPAEVETYGMTEPDPKEFYTTSGEGYMGASAFYGSKSKTRLYGADLTSELRAQFKRHNIKNVTVRMGRGSDVIVTIKAEAGDMIDFDSFCQSVASYKFEANCTNSWIYYIDKDGIDHSIHWDSFQALPEDEQEEIKEGWIKAYYNSYAKGDRTPSIYHYNECEVYSPKLIKKMDFITRIINAYNYDESNSMVDYFNRGIYWDFAIKAQ